MCACVGHDGCVVAYRSAGVDSVWWLLLLAVRLVLDSRETWLFCWRALPQVVSFLGMARLCVRIQRYPVWFVARRVYACAFNSAVENARCVDKRVLSACTRFGL